MPSSERIYDPYSHEMQQDPYPAYAWFRDNAPCAYNPRMDFYALFRFEDVWNATLDWKTFSSRLGPTLENRGQLPGEFFSIIGMDPPRHTAYRRRAVDARRSGCDRGRRRLAGRQRGRRARMRQVCSGPAARCAGRSRGRLLPRRRAHRRLDGAGLRMRGPVAGARLRLCRLQ